MNFVFRIIVILSILIIWHFLSFEYRTSKNSTRKMISRKKKLTQLLTHLGEHTQQFHVANLKLSHTKVWNTHQNSFTFKCQSTIFLFVCRQQLKEKKKKYRKLEDFRVSFSVCKCFGLPCAKCLLWQSLSSSFSRKKKTFLLCKIQTAMLPLSFFFQWDSFIFMKFHIVLKTFHRFSRLS